MNKAVFAGDAHALSFKWSGTLSLSRLQALGVGIAAVFAIPVLLLLLLDAKGHANTEERISDALSSHYAPATTEVIERVDWYFGDGDFSFGGQICFVIDVHQPSGPRARKVAMFADWDDGGAFTFAREYTSLAGCKRGFFPG